jgi:hypothetical protein
MMMRDRERERQRERETERESERETERRSPCVQLLTAAGWLMNECENGMNTI